MTRLVFLDTETTGLDPARHHIWDVAWITRDDDGADKEQQAFLLAPLQDADPAALRIGRYFDRHPYPFNEWDVGDDDLISRALSPWQAARRLAHDLRDAIILGFNPAFDAEFLRALFRAHELPPTWSYRTVDVTCIAAARLRLEPPYSTHEMLDFYGIDIPPFSRHSALGDARLSRDLYDAIRASDA